MSIVTKLVYLAFDSVEERHVQEVLQRMVAKVVVKNVMGLKVTGPAVEKHPSASSRCYRIAGQDLPALI